MNRLVRQLWFQLLVALLVGWGAFHFGYWYESGVDMRTSPHDGQAGMDILAAGAVASVAGFLGTLLLFAVVLRLRKKPSEEE